MTEQSVRKKRRRVLDDSSSAKANTEGTWLTSYADLMSLMACFFILLVGFANYEDPIFQKRAQEMARYFNGSLIEDSGEKGEVDVSASQKSTKQGKKNERVLEPIVGEMVDQSEAASPTSTSEQSEEMQKQDLEQSAAEKEKAEQEKVQMQQLLASVKEFSDSSKTVTVSYEQGLEIVFTSSNFFESGHVAPDREVEESIDFLIDIIKNAGYNFPIMIEGHTDGVPLNSKIYPSNWELSSVRAAYVLRKFERAGFPPERLVAVGFGSARPLYSEVNGLGKPILENRRHNRRVIIKVLYPKDAPRDKIGLGVFF
ncbi:MAG: hypothetical protein A2504_10070 [Bdellovibrionales bacterium RIFOXYD12_FULL_39_22]|nr:MAG: hypothetical protein A2385_17705 [Bdellovibrionales bacterium RIFOXYB1_FULL_39_21]OFZ43955.1 MAG: hypothetical protein A2485_04375 [Bdellovibrionales bacterium RIFOXYC12_FULL_39_17]OFZ48327.1 MAG: hypothetical protein A2404_01790 [Bdellovibrionales bacterium RIFOXYC1_FULL_39_130]OFZ76632.1 MAG: hypothetical protein A2560_17385 [Bdellovibrionales bacterium RIFOXYD1_FULL_39_84]OFZ94918.1 MAG: hypothetical protein A2504_10070 [Bdellovibrionales bacterium RIFOXYD12_FULL_39_22]HLE12660.1 fl